MSTTTEIHLPDIGDFKDVPVIEVHVKPGSKVNVDDTLITLESDKATMDIPATASGTVREVRVKTGDRISQGDLDPHLGSRGSAGHSAQGADPGGRCSVPWPRPSRLRQCQRCV